MQTVFKRSGAYIFIGGLMLVIEFILIQVDMIKVELPDRKLDLPTIIIAIIAWVLMFLGLYSLSLSHLFVKKRSVFYVSLTGLALYTLGCLLILLGFWNLTFIIPIGLLLTAVGMIAIGLTAKQSLGIKKPFYVACLCVGTYPFICMFPIVLITGSPNYSVNYFWGFLWCFFGYIIYRKP